MCDILYSQDVKTIGEKKTMTGNYERRYARPTRRTSDAARVAKRVKKAVVAKQNDFFVLVSGIVLGLFVFIGCNLSVAAERGYNGGIGGELILAVAVACGVYFLWTKIKKHLKD